VSSLALQALGRTLVATVLGVSVVVILARLLGGCAANDVALYAEDQQLCVAKAASKEEADACRAAAKAKWHDKWRKEYGPEAGF